MILLSPSPSLMEFLTLSLYHSGEEAILIFRKNYLPPYPTSHTMWHLYPLPTVCQKAPPCSPNTRFKASAYSEAVTFVRTLTQVAVKAYPATLLLGSGFLSFPKATLLLP